jgi:hypothetical protein
MCKKIENIFAVLLIKYKKAYRSERFRGLLYTFAQAKQT